MRTLALVCIHLNAKAQSRLLDLLPESLAPGVRDFVRRGEEIVSGELTEGEVRVLRMFRRPPEEELKGEADRDVVESTGDGAVGEAMEDEAEIESFFSEGEEKMEAAALQEGVVTEDGPSLPPVLVGLLLQEAEPREAARLLVELPLRFQGQVVDLIVTSSALAASRGLESDDCALIESLRANLSGRESWGVESAVQILRSIDTTRRLRRAITATAQIDAEAVSILQNHLFVFEDILKIDDREFQTLLGRVDNRTMALAMKVTSDAVRDRFFGNMSARRAALVRDETELQEDLTLEDIEEAQKSILESLRQLYENGDISTYFGSVQGEFEADVDEDEEDDDAGDTEERVASEKPSDSERKHAVERVAETRSRTPVLFASGLILAAVLVTVAVLHLTMRDSPRTLEGEKVIGESGNRSRSGRSSSRSTPKVAVQWDERSISEQQAQDSGIDPVPVDPSAFATGEVITVPADIEAILMLPGSDGRTNGARVEAEPESELQKTGTTGSPADSSGRGGGALMLRMGKVRTAILEDGFVVQSPLVEVRGRKGAVFSMRVVLDATTTVEVEIGEVSVTSSGGRDLLLTRGQVARFAPGGGHEIDRVATPEKEEG